MPKVINYTKLDSSKSQEEKETILNDFMQSVDETFVKLKLPTIVDLSFTTRSDYASPNFGFDIIRVSSNGDSLYLSQIQQINGASIRVPVYMSWRNEYGTLIIDYIAGLNPNTSYRLKVGVL